MNIEMKIIQMRNFRVFFCNTSNLIEKGKLIIENHNLKLSYKIVILIINYQFFFFICSTHIFHSQFILTDKCFISSIFRRKACLPFNMYQNSQRKKKKEKLIILLYLIISCLAINFIFVYFLK